MDMSLEEVLNEYGFDWRNLDFDLIKTLLVYSDLREIILPEDINFFQKIEAKAIEGCILPAIDYSLYNFEGVNISYCQFEKGTILPNNVDFFQKIEDKNIILCKLPKKNYTIYNFKDVKIDKSNLIEFICEESIGYDLNQFEYLNFSTVNCQGLMSEQEANLIKIRYPKRIENKTIILPKILRENNLSSKYDDLI